MKLPKKKIVNTVIWSTLLVALLVTMSFIGGEQQNTICQGVEINIEPKVGNHFVDDTMVVSAISHGKGLSYITSMPTSRISLSDMEKELLLNPFIKNAEVYEALNGVLKVEVNQRRPLIRIITSAGVSYYIDEDGFKMPASTLYTARVMVATGNIKETDELTDSLRSKTLQELYTLAHYVDKNTFWKAQFEQIFVDRDNNIVVIPKVGNHEIILGNTDHLEEKLENLYIFYRKGLNKIGWDKYKTINLKFKGQIVCEKY